MRSLEARLARLERLIPAGLHDWHPLIIECCGEHDAGAAARIQAAHETALAAGCGPGEIHVVVVHRPAEWAA
ncbi:MAG TPA: hypothetical protein VMV87_03415 [Burkholderiales bacterium]|nr:hypothetical protein [Burkholderiales bacterium]